MEYEKVEDYKNMKITAYAVTRAWAAGEGIPQDRNVFKLAQAYIEAVNDMETMYSSLSLMTAEHGRLKNAQVQTAKIAKDAVEDQLRDMGIARTAGVRRSLVALTKLYFREVWFILRRGKLTLPNPTGRTGEVWRSPSNDNLPNLTTKGDN